MVKLGTLSNVLYQIHDEMLYGYTKSSKSKKSYLLLVFDHLFKLGVGESRLGLELVGFDAQTLLQILDLLHSLADLLKTNVEMQLLLLQLGSLLVVQLGWEGKEKQ